MSEIIDAILIFLSGWILGRAYMVYQNNTKLRDLLSRVKEDYEAKFVIIDDKPLEFDEMDEIMAPVLSIEKHGNILYAYNQETQEFVCQGENLEAIATLLYNGTGKNKISIARIIEGENTVWAVKGKIQKELNRHDSHSN